MVFLHIQLSSVSCRAKADSCFILHSILCIQCLRCTFSSWQWFPPQKSLTAHKADSALSCPRPELLVWMECRRHKAQEMPSLQVRAAVWCWHCPAEIPPQHPLLRGTEEPPARCTASCRSSSHCWPFMPKPLSSHSIGAEKTRLLQGLVLRSVNTGSTCSAFWPRTALGAVGVLCVCSLSAPILQTAPALPQ